MYLILRNKKDILKDSDPEGKENPTFMFEDKVRMIAAVKMTWNVNKVTLTMFYLAFHNLFLGKRELKW